MVRPLVSCGSIGSRTDALSCRFLSRDANASTHIVETASRHPLPAVASFKNTAGESSPPASVPALSATTSDAPFRRNDIAVVWNLTVRHRCASTGAHIAPSTPPTARHVITPSADSCSEPANATAPIHARRVANHAANVTVCGGGVGPAAARRRCHQERVHPDRRPQRGAAQRGQENGHIHVTGMRHEQLAREHEIRSDVNDGEREDEQARIVTRAVAHRARPALARHRRRRAMQPVPSREPRPQSP